MSINKKEFLKVVTVLIDSREQKNKHITDKLTEYGVPFVSRSLDYGDYSFVTREKTAKDTYKERDFSFSCTIERKRNVDEIYGNIMTDRQRLENEFHEANKLSSEFILLIENCDSMSELRSCKLKEFELKQSPMRQVTDIGEYVYQTIMSWRCKNRYNFTVEFTKDKGLTAAKLLELFYYYWANYKKLSQNRAKN